MAGESYREHLARIDDALARNAKFVWRPLSSLQVGALLFGGMVLGMMFLAATILSFGEVTR
jgi:hypothetical protein